MTGYTGPRRDRRVWPLAVAVPLVVLLAAATWWRLSTGAENEADSVTAGSGSVDAAAAGSSAPDVAVPVAGDTVRRGALVLEVSATGQTEASRRTVVTARVAGRIAALPVGESERVGAGRTLVRLDPGEYALAVERAGAELEEARARYREMTLFDASIADSAVRAERATAARAKSGLARAEIALREARLDLANATLTAPFAGRVADVRVTPGAWVATGEEILTLVDVRPIRVEVQVVESELGWIAPGAGAAVRLSAFPDETFRGRIVSINPVVDPQARTARVTVEIPNPDDRILPGMFARVVLEGRRIENVVTVPVEALIERDGRHLVFVFEPVPDGPPGEGRAKWVYVTPGRSNAERVEFVESEGTDVPEPGTVVLVDGHFTLVHDATVRLREEG